MANVLWTSHFVRVSVANMLLFVSLYMLYPVLPVVMASRLSVPITHTGLLYLVSMLGMLFIGPFYNYLIDECKRKNIFSWAFVAMIATIAGYALVSSLTELLLLCFFQGVAFGLSTTSGITLAIDVTHASERNSGNVIFSGATRLGMILGIALGVSLFGLYGFDLLLYISIGIGALGVLMLSGVYVPFRAPLVTKICSYDRFLLPRALLPAFNLALIAFVPGMLLPVLLHSPVRVWVGEVSVPFFAVAAVGFLLMILLLKFIFRGALKMWLQIVLGLILMIVAIAFMSQVILPQITELLLAAILFGLSLGMIAPQFLNMFVKLSQHCQRGTANTTHLLAWEIGITAGIATACWMDVSARPEIFYQIGVISTAVALVFFVLVTYPYFKRRKVRSREL